MELQLTANPGAIREGRHWVVRCAVAEGADGDAARVLELLTSELVTNAVKYGPPGGTITVNACRRDGAFDVAVSDEAPVPPVTRDPRPSETGGRGLRLVASLSAEWGVRMHRGAGKSVWFRVPLGGPLPCAAEAVGAHPAG